MLNERFAGARWALTGALVVAAILAFPATASAHSEVVTTTPEAGSTLDAPPTEVVLEFDEGVQEQGGTIVVSVGDQVVSQAGTFTASGTTASVQLKPVDLSGTYQVAYRIVSEDGHVGRESFSFEVQGTSSTATPQTQTPDTTPVSSSDDSSDSNATVIWVLGLGAIGLVLVAALIAVAMRGRRGRSS
jgi:copper resistance protein C